MSFSARFIRTAHAYFFPGAGSGARLEFTNRFAASCARGCLALLFALWAPLISPFASAHAADISIESRVGFHGVFQLGHPFPLEVTIGNFGGSAEGTVEVRVWKGRAATGGPPYPLIYRREIFVSAQSRKTIEFTVDPDFVSRPLSVSFASPAGDSKQEVDLRRYFSPAPVMLLVSESSFVPPISLPRSSPSHLVELSLPELPADARAWLGVSHLILYDESLRDLSRAQIAALEGWLAAGGRMVILASINYPLYQGPAISRFLPVRVTGARQIAFTLPLGDHKRPPPVAAAWAQASTTISGKVLAESEGLPLLVESSRGKGRITYLAFDLGRPPLSQWEGLPELWQNLLAPAVADDAPPRTRWDDSVFSQLMLSPSFASAYIPTGSLFLAVCGYLLGMGVWVWLWERKRMAARHLVAIFAGFVIVMTLTGYMLFSRGGNVPDGVLLSATVLDGSGDGYADAQSNLALFSTQLRPYNLQLEGTWIDLVPLSSPAEERSEPTVIVRGGGASEYRLELREWDYRLFRMRSVARFPVRAEFQPQGDKLLVQIDNRSAKDLTECWLILPGQRYALGDIPRGATRKQSFPLTAATLSDDASGGRAPTIDFRDFSLAEKTRDVLFHASFFPREGEITPWASGAAAIFFGWVKDPEPRARVSDPRVRVQQYTLFRAMTPLAGPEDE